MTISYANGRGLNSVISGHSQVYKPLHQPDDLNLWGFRCENWYLLWSELCCMCNRYICAMVYV